MATSTTNYSFTLPEVGGDTDQWGTQLNANWTSLDSTLKTVADSVGDDVTLTGNDYLTISGQSITVGDVDLTTDVTGTLPVGSGGTGLAALGTANQVLGVNSGGTSLEYKTLSTGGTVTSVAVTGSDGIEVDSGSPITSSGTIVLGINSTSLSTHLGLGSLATQSSVTESQISDLGSYITASSTDTLTNKSGNISQWTNDSGYLTAETNDLSNVSGTLAIANGGTGQTTAATARVALLPTLATNGSKLVAVNSGATDIEYIATSTLSITESQISDLQSYLTAETNDLSAAVTWANVPDANITQSSVTQHQAALSITESQISDLQSYLTAEVNDLSAAVTGTLGTANGGTGLTAIGTANQVLAVNSGATGLEFQTISITESQISDLQSYLTAESNDLSSVVTWANVPDVNITESSVTQHQAALSITESQISDLGTYQTSDAGLTSIAGLTTAADKMIYTTAADTYAVTALTTAGRALLDDADAAAQRTTLGLGSLATQSTITESQISDLQSYLTAETNDLSTAVTGTLGTGNGGTGLTALGSAGQVLTVNSGGNALEYQTPASPGISTGKAIAMAIVFG